MLPNAEKENAESGAVIAVWRSRSALILVGLVIFCILYPQLQIFPISPAA
jgi:hypothetical protein